MLRSIRGGFRGVYALSSGMRPPANPKDPPSYSFQISIFGDGPPKNFLKTPWAPVYTNVEGEARAEKLQFFGQNFPKKAQ